MLIILLDEVICLTIARMICFQWFASWMIISGEKLKGSFGSFSSLWFKWYSDSSLLWVFLYRRWYAKRHVSMWKMKRKMKHLKWFFFLICPDLHIGVSTSWMGLWRFEARLQVYSRVFSNCLGRIWKVLLDVKLSSNWWVVYVGCSELLIFWSWFRARHFGTLFLIELFWIT